MHDEEYGEWLTKEEKFHLDNAKAGDSASVFWGRGPKLNPDEDHHPKVRKGG